MTQFYNQTIDNIRLSPPSKSRTRQERRTTLFLALRPWKSTKRRTSRILVLFADESRTASHKVEVFFKFFFTRDVRICDEIDLFRGIISVLNLARKVLSGGQRLCFGQEQWRTLAAWRCEGFRQGRSGIYRPILHQRNPFSFHPFNL